MFESIKGLWRGARGGMLRKEFVDLTLRLPTLSEPQAERCGRFASLLLRDWNARFGPVKDAQVSLRKAGVEQFKSVARQRFETDVGAAFGYALMSMHLESSYLPGADAKTVFDLSSAVILQYVDLDGRLGQNTE
jgi:hypothetical protein